MAPLKNDSSESTLSSASHHPATSLSSKRKLSEPGDFPAVPSSSDVTSPAPMFFEPDDPPPPPKKRKSVRTNKATSTTHLKPVRSSPPRVKYEPVRSSPSKFGSPAAFVTESPSAAHKTASRSQPLFLAGSDDNAWSPSSPSNDSHMQLYLSPPRSESVAFAQLAPSYSQLYTSPEGDSFYARPVSCSPMLPPKTSHSTDHDLLDDFDDYMQEQDGSTYNAHAALDVVPSPRRPQDTARLHVTALPPLSPRPLSSPFKHELPATPVVDPVTASINDDLAQFEEWFLGGNVIIEDA
ncbi:hypothetical protein EXIGLDRAFT_439125 [Exidia glandulosa HHB12029]|uniref:Uncharacterized protein n=1 Tax=Exidia glandulosa HHB12029 TaxID=1314781 RepID=A0A165KEE6_EXIGL|nr:hypothetical protein EXIGLDRAFT_439125 [Exidia glandulosa HHB12029]